jgi:secreted protein with Ig-like and vWFA domain
MTIEYNDPRITAFVLGELTDDEAKEIQTAIENDAELQSEVEAIRKTVAEIETALKEEPVNESNHLSVGPHLSGGRKPPVDAARQGAYAPRSSTKRRWLVKILAVAATFAFVYGAFYAENRISEFTGTVTEVAKFDTVEKPKAEVSPSTNGAEVVHEAQTNRPLIAPNNDIADGNARIDKFAAVEERRAAQKQSEQLYFRDSTRSDSAKSYPRSAIRTNGVMAGRMHQSSMMVTPHFTIQEEREELRRERPADDSFNKEKSESYKNTEENPFKIVKSGEFSTFSIDVDTASYGTMRRFVNSGQKVPDDSVRLEEFINYFKYYYVAPTDGKPFAVHTDLAQCPWEPKHLLAKIGIKGKEYSTDERPPLNLVFLVDVSGSMSASNRLPLVVKSLTELVEMLQGKDRIAIVTYAGQSKVALPSVSGNEKRAILDSLNGLNAGGSTAGAAGIKTAYETARKYYDKNGQNRVILCTDGDFNVGETDNGKLETMISDEAKSGVFLTILGFGMGNYKDERLKTLSMKGNGNYGYIDTPEEARKLLVEGLTGTLFAIAKDVKIQVDFNPAKIAGYRLLGYENRKLRDEDFNNDKVDAGEIGAGHTVTALYEIVPAGIDVPQAVDKSRYSEKEEVKNGGTSSAANNSDELLFVKIRYKEPKEDKSKLIEVPVKNTKENTKEAGALAPADADTPAADTEFVSGVALFGMLLRHSQYSGSGTFDTVLQLCEKNTKDDKYRKEFIDIVKKAKEL